MYPKARLAQLLTASCCANQIIDVILSPGSRNAPLIIGFNQIDGINTYSIVDERCAGFLAIGMAKQQKKAVVIVCTSGSALLNYYPSISEAFYSHIPLVIISADRPKHLIDIGDGQTIRQEKVFGNHILFEANLSPIQNDLDLSFNEYLIHKAIQISNVEKGPTHVNIPLDEPLYELTDTLFKYPHTPHLSGFNFSKSLSTQENLKDLKKYAEIWNRSHKKMILVGSCDFDESLQEKIDLFLKDPSVLILTETTSNLKNEHCINSIDQFLLGLKKIDKQYFQPDILLSIGGSIVSKKIKQYLRSFLPKEHWAVHPTIANDTFFSLKHHFKQNPNSFLEKFYTLVKPIKSDYQKKALFIKAELKLQHKIFIKTAPYSDLKIFHLLNEKLPSNIILQFSNSSPIRYSQLFDIDQSIHVFSNRGTNGIEGSTSTAIGYAIKTKKPVILITGDISFFYDSNALWNNYIPKNFRIIIINNKGGGIFKILINSKKFTDLSFCETPHDYNAMYLAKMHRFKYDSASDLDSLEKKLDSFYRKSSSPKILEIFSPSDTNHKVLKQYFNFLEKRPN